MARISDYNDGGQPTNAAEFIVARSGTTRKLNFANINSYLATLYSTPDKGVTDGNSHDHTDGNGETIDHTGLSNIGTNTHAQIDTHLAEPFFCMSPEPTDQQSFDTTLVYDPYLYLVLPSKDVIYSVRGAIWYYVDVSTGIEVWVGNAGTPAPGWGMRWLYPSPATTTPFINVIYGWPFGWSDGVATGVGFFTFHAWIQPPSDNFTFGIYWGQATLGVAGATIRKGSYISAMPEAGTTT